jgi:uncharacterized Fe-S cluster protein YjdI/CDGSH-type Zn-finger protein
MTRQLQVYETSQIRVTFDPKVCEHSGKCVKNLPAVFDVSRREWVDPSKATSQEVMRAIAACPSGALNSTLVTSVHRILSDAPPITEPTEPTRETVTITVRPNASLLVEGPFRVVDKEGSLIREAEKCSLCRCGHSKNKPFCDGSHKESGWSSS